MGTRRAVRGVLEEGGPMKFEENLSRLERVVAEMEGGKLSLDDMMKHFEEGKALVAA